MIPRALILGISAALTLAAQQQPTGQTAAHKDSGSQSPSCIAAESYMTDSALPAAEPPAGTPGGQAAEQRIRAAGKLTSVSPSPRSSYRNLLRTIAAPEDRATYGDFCDFGYWAGTSYAGHNDLTPGYWVYLAPNWYIFQEQVTGPATAPTGKRAWGPEQATGKPDTWPQSGDLGTAWASKTPDGQREWLELTYEHAIRPVAAMVYETYNPGAVDRVTGFDAAGKEIELWSGSDPTPAGKDKGISVIPLHPDFDLTRIRIYLDSPKVAGWNEIDAVGLVDESGKTHWAKSATASSTYADQTSNDAELEVLTVPSIRLR